MASLVRIGVSVGVQPTEGAPLAYLDRLVRYGLPVSLGTGDRRQVTIGSASFQGLTVPSGARYCLIEIPANSESLFLKNVTGDSTGIAMTSATAADVGPTLALIPVGGTSPGIGILNSGDASVTVTVTML